MAVEMAKLSLWLITLAKDRPFSFVDHALRAGDSLLGVTDLKQLRVAHLDPSWHRQASLDLGFDEIEAAVDRALALRHELEAFVVRDVLDAERKAAMLAQADAALDDARLLGDLVVGAALAQLDDADPLASADVARNIRTMVDHEAPELERMVARTQLRDARRDVAGRDPARGRRGARGRLGRPPPVPLGARVPRGAGARRVRRDRRQPAVPGRHRRSAARSGASTATTSSSGSPAACAGSADLVAYFYLRAATLLRPSGGFGLIATNTIAQGDTREVGLDQLADERLDDPPRDRERAVAWRREPGDGDRLGTTRRLGGRSRARPGRSRRDHAGAHGPQAASTGNAAPACTRTATARSRARIVIGMGFVLSPDGGGSDARRRSHATLRSSGRTSSARTSTQRPDGSPSRWVIDFRDWPEERARDVRRAIRTTSSSSFDRSAREANARALPRALVAVRRQAPGAVPRDRAARPLHRDHA